jgi:hypothetical protein
VQEGKKTAGCCETVATVVKAGGNWCGGFVVVMVVGVGSCGGGDGGGGGSNILGLNLYSWYNFIRGTLLETCPLISVQGFVCV